MLRSLQQRLKRISAARAIAGGFAVLVVAVATLFALHASGQRRAMHEAARKDAEIRAVTLAEQAGRLLDSADLLLDQIMLMPAAHGWRWDAIGSDPANHRELKRLCDRYGYVEALWLTDQDGWPRVTSRQFPAPRIDTSDREYFVAHRQRRTGPLLSRLIKSRITGRSNIVLARRLEDGHGNFVGIAQAVLPPPYFLSFYESLALPPGTEVTLFRNDLAVIVRYPVVADEVALKLDKWTTPAAVWDGRPAGSGRSTSPADGVERLESWRKVGRFPVYVGVGHSVPAIEAAWRRAMLLQGSAVGAVLGLVGLASLLAWRLAKREERALAGLEDRVRQRTADLDAALAARDLLLKEVHHRVKNNLQLVSSLLTLQGRQATDEGTRLSLQEASARVTAIADLHRNLYQGDRPDLVELASYLRDLCADLRSAGLDGANRLEVSTEPVELPVDVVVPLALVVTELVANALKHGYGNGRAGPVTVTQRRGPGGGAVIEVADSGPGKRPDARAGFGTSLVRALMRQIRGELHEEADAQGTRFTLVVPAPPSGDTGSSSANRRPSDR